MTSRRAILAAPAFFAGVAAFTSGCQIYGGEAAPPADAAAPAGPAGPVVPAGTAKAPAAAPALGKLADIPVGGGRVFAAQKVVVTQPEPGVVKAFSAVCTHQGCVVSEVAGGRIKCPCHGSAFRIADGSVAAGPATKPLPAAKVTVDGESIRLD
jgi:Rieske Fe-S protein